MAMKLIYEPSEGVNLMSREKFRALRSQNHEFFSFDPLPPFMKFRSNFTAKIGCGNKTLISSIFVKEEDDEYLTINKATADRLELNL